MKWRLEEGEQRRAAAELQGAVLEERARIARELHDVVAHHLSLVAVQAETAPAVSRTSGPAVRRRWPPSPRPRATR